MDGRDCKQFEFEATNHGDALLAGLRHLRDKHQLFDVTFVVDNQELPAHRVVLASCSDYFRAMFTDGLRECQQSRIELSGVTARGMKNLLDFAYTSKSNIDRDNVYDVLSASTHCQIIPVIEAVEDFLRSHLSLDNCVDVAEVADLYSLLSLQQYVHQFICKHWTSFTLSTDFHLMNQQAVAGVLASGFPVDCSEAEVLISVLSWLKYSPKDRQHMVEDILQHVLFKNINEQNVREILKLQEWKDLIESVSCLKQRYSSLLGPQKWISQIFIRSNTESNIPLGSSLTNMRGLHEVVLVAGGFSGESGMTNNIWYYDENPESSLKHLTKIPHVEQCNFGMTAMQNKLYVIGGCFNDQFDEVVHPFGFQYDPLKDKWESIAQMMHERCRFFLAASGGYLYAIGGDPLASDVTLDGAPCERYDPESNSWEEMAPVPGNRTQHAGVVAGPYIYISGGQQEADGEILNDFFRFHTRQNTWTRCSSMLSPRVDHSMFFYNGKVYVIGGWQYSQLGQREMVSSIDCYNMTTDLWETVSVLSETRLYATYTLHKSALYVIGGWRRGDYRLKSQTVECLDLRTHKWKKQNSQPLEIWEHCACTLFVPKCIST